jgi:hypothetical protein
VKNGNFSYENVFEVVWMVKRIEIFLFRNFNSGFSF